MKNFFYKLKLCVTRISMIDDFITTLMTICFGMFFFATVSAVMNLRGDIANDVIIAIITTACMLGLLIIRIIYKFFWKGDEDE